MRISLLLEREPFPEIFERTLTGFLRDRTGETHEVRWHAGKPASPKGQVWLCNQYLNAIFVQGVRQSVLEPVLREFSRSTKPWRTPLQKLYVSLATARHTSAWFAGAFVEIDAPLAGAEDCLILGGNHHLRFLDYRKGCCFVIRKSGFSADFFTAELRVRQGNPYLPVPLIQEVAADGSWYSEALVFGTPINRLWDRHQAEWAVQEVLPPLLRLYEETKEDMTTAEYVHSLVERLKGLIAANRHLPTPEQGDLLREVERLGRVAVSATDNGVTRTVQSHGDFQAANILYDDDKRGWLIDWEYTGRRQVAFDALVCGLNSRYPSGLTRRIAELVRNRCLPDDTLVGDTLVQWAGSVGRGGIALFLLEELELRLREVDNQLFKTLGVGFALFREEMGRAVSVLEGG